MPRITSILKRLIQRSRRDLAPRVRLVYLILYGSQARGTANPNSDLDIMVVLKVKISAYQEIIRMGKITTELSLKYNELISVFPISEENYLSQSTPLLKNIHQD